MTTHTDTAETYRIEFASWSPEPLVIPVDAVPDDVDVVAYVESNFDIWELSVRPGRWSGEEFDAVTVAAASQADAEERALAAHRNYRSVISNSHAVLDPAEVSSVERV